jgi:hypothetical protein
MTDHTAAWERFWRSTRIGYMEWHDGIGYDLDALGEMTAEERAETVRTLRGRPQDWRDVEAYGSVDTSEARAALRDALRSERAETRLHAATKLHDLGERISLQEVVVRELSRVTIADGMTVALRIAARVPTPDVRRALLAGAGRRPEVAFHYAMLLCSLTGVSDSHEFGERRPLFLRLGERATPEDRRAAFAELCQLTGMHEDSGT